MFSVCVQVEALRRADHPSKKSYRLSLTKKLRKLSPMLQKREQAPKCGSNEEERKVLIENIHLCKLIALECSIVFTCNLWSVWVNIFQPKYTNKRWFQIKQRNERWVPCLTFRILSSQKKRGFLVRKRTIPTEQPPHVGEISANFSG
jgi:hypothetical protein